MLKTIDSMSSTGTVTLGNCPRCHRGIVNKHELPSVDAEIVESQYGYQTSEFGEPICEWLPRVHYLVTVFTECPHCNARLQQDLKAIDNKEDAEVFASKHRKC